MKLFKYRIATDSHRGYELQYKCIFSFRWRSDYKSFVTPEEVEEYFKKEYNNKVVKYL